MHRYIRTTVPNVVKDCRDGHFSRMTISVFSGDTDFMMMEMIEQDDYTYLLCLQDKGSVLI